MTKGFKDPCAAITPSANSESESKGLASRLKVNSSIRPSTRLAQSVQTPVKVGRNGVVGSSIPWTPTRETPVSETG